MFVRNGAGLLLLTAVCMALIYFSVRSDVSTSSAEKAHDWRMQTILSPVLAILFGLVLTLTGFDLVMSLDPHWYSTLFGAYYFIGSFYTGLAALVFLATLFRRKPGADKFLGDQQFHDLGKLLFAFCMVTGYLFFTQFLVIWYGNLPEETRYVILRVVTTPWEPVAWVVLAAIFIIPFPVLLNRNVKMKTTVMMGLSILSIIGLWLERFILVAPSLWKQLGIPLGLTELGITGGFLGAVALSIIIFFRRVPLFPLSGPLFPETHETAAEQAVVAGGD
jgi:Ni/Fe-hydrogenase subunit HybB-like protein